MRKQWFGDSRDYVKWSCVYRKAGLTHAVLYIPMLRPDSLTGENLEPAVANFFDGLKDFRAFERLFPNRFAFVADIYSKVNADSYFDTVERELIRLQELSTVLVFVDPDTGLQPGKSPKEEHLRTVDFERLAMSLRPGDKLSIYQHASRSSDWIDQERVLLDIAYSSRNFHQDDPYTEVGVSRDVCFLTITKGEESTL